jgi:hypothetical protein
MVRTLDGSTGKGMAWRQVVARTVSHLHASGYPYDSASEVLLS